ncbi:hypothetical protein PHYSODRAFT_296623 [Phytophthora sojae]|uniref:Uncharacterized protein n=1 Tax=Phytophthora sojae (strain P6497) TaxID=1094619 RepID=G4YZC0_PHYSP|nr:hypothetical protein PHYSODRAFT_296623 [Phytophthora sojae]EGZ24595.1 hypothetical protein PHYSODRAFT_296623 [Phytophthora sojae]|eukprot:XP_009519883.1 hypothetical protein PHYSODRAFT_296623 [Phytophthora sojae]
MVTTTWNCTVSVLREETLVGAVVEVAAHQQFLSVGHVEAKASVCSSWRPQARKKLVLLPISCISFLGVLVCSHIEVAKPLCQFSFSKIELKPLYLLQYQRRTMRAAFELAQANWYRLVKVNSEQQRNSDESDDPRRAMEADICKLKVLVGAENLALRARAMGATQSPLNLQLRRARAIVNGFQDLHDFCVSTPPVENACHSSVEKVVLINDESEEDEAAPTRRLFTKKRMIASCEDGTVQGKENKRAKHAHNLASIGDDGVATATEEHKEERDSSAQMAEVDSEQARDERFASVELHGQEQPEGSEGLTLTGWAVGTGIPAESFVAARAIFTASRTAGVRGVSLAQFVGALLGEIEVDIDICNIPIPSADTPSPSCRPPTSHGLKGF